MELPVNQSTGPESRTSTLRNKPAAALAVETGIPRRRRIFTPTTVEIVRTLASQGRSAQQIADAIGSTAGSVRVKCCLLKIKLMRRGRPSGVRTMRGEKLAVYMGPAAYTAFSHRAAEMQKSAPELAATLLEAIVSSNLYAAVLE